MQRWNTWNWQCEKRSHCCAVVECRTRHPEVPSSNPSVGKKKILSQVQSEQYHHQSLYTRVKYLKLSEVKTKLLAVVECRTRDPEIPSSNAGVHSTSELNTWNCQSENIKSQLKELDPEVPSVAKKKISHRSNQNNTTTNPSPPDLITW